jgi:hypothetical protein
LLSLGRSEIHILASDSLVDFENVLASLFEVSLRIEGLGDEDFVLGSIRLGLVNWAHKEEPAGETQGVCV